MFFRKQKCKKNYEKEIANCLLRNRCDMNRTNNRENEKEGHWDEHGKHGRRQIRKKRESVELVMDSILYKRQKIEIESISSIETNRDERNRSISTPHSIG